MVYPNIIAHHIIPSNSKLSGLAFNLEPGYLRHNDVLIVCIPLHVDVSSNVNTLYYLLLLGMRVEINASTIFYPLLLGMRVEIKCSSAAQLRFAHSENKS